MKAFLHKFAKDHLILNSLNTELCCIPLYFFLVLILSIWLTIKPNNFKESFLLEFLKNIIKPPSLQKKSYEITPVHLSICLPPDRSVTHFSQDLLLIYIIFCMRIFCHVQFAIIHTSSLINIEKILNRPITKFYNSDDINVIAAELRFTKTRPTSFYKKHNLL